MTIFKSIYTATVVSFLLPTQIFAHDLTTDYSKSYLINSESKLNEYKSINEPTEKINSIDSENYLEEKKQITSSPPLINFSNSITKDYAKITQLTIFDKSQLKIAGIEEKEIYKFVYQFEEHAKNIFHSNTISDGKFIYGITIKPSIDNAKKRAVELGLNPNDINIIDNICTKEPTHCSITSISSFQNGAIPKILFMQFEKDIIEKTSEIFWNNYKQDGTIKFFFEVSLKNLI